MVWKTKKVGDGAWIGPMKVVQQEGQFSKVEQQGETQQIIPPGVVQLQDWTRVPDTMTIPRTRAQTTGVPPEVLPGSNSRPEQNASSSENPGRNPEMEQPDGEPSVSRAPSQAETSSIPIGETSQTGVPDGVEVPEDDASTLLQSTEAWKCSSLPHSRP